MTAPVDLPLELAVDEVAPLTSPVLVVALTGWFDAGSVATTALAHVADHHGGVVVGEIDPDPFYDFTVARPAIELVDGERVIAWPRSQFHVVRTGGPHDIVALIGVEPHVAWPTYVDCIVAALRRMGVAFVVTLGAVASATPHTRPPVVVGSTTDPTLGGRLGLGGPTYQGPTGVVGVLHGVLEASRVPSVSLRVGVPNYLPEGEHPRSVAALLAHLAHVLGTALPIDLDASIRMWDEAHDAWVADNERMRAYVELLEQHYDARIDETVAQFEDLLREADDESDDD